MSDVKEVTVKFTSDQPAKSVVCKIPAKLSMLQLRVKASSQLGIEGQVISRSAFGIVRYGFDVIDLASSTSDTREITIEPLTTVLVYAPMDVARAKPVLPFDSGEHLDAKLEGASDAKTKHKIMGLTPENAFEKYGEATSAVQRKVCQDYIFQNATRLFKAEAKGLLSLKEDDLVELVRSDDLAVASEIDVLNAAVAWGKARVEEAAKSDSKSPSSLAQALQKVTPHIRFPRLETSQVATLSALGILESQQVLDLFTISATPAEKRQLPDSLKDFSLKPRAGKDS